MARRKNVKRIDPRYFLHETVNRNDDGSRLVEIWGLSHKEKLEKYWDPEDVFTTDRSYDGSIGGDLARNWLRHELQANYKDMGDYFGPNRQERIVKKARKIWLERTPKYTRGSMSSGVVDAIKMVLEPWAEQRRAAQAKRRRADEAEAQGRRDKEAERLEAERAREAQWEKEFEAEQDRLDAEAQRGTGSWTDVFDFAHQLEEGKITTRKKGK